MIAAERIDNPANDVTGYALYGTVENDTYSAIQSAATTNPVIGAGATIWLNTDQNSEYTITDPAALSPPLYRAGEVLRLGWA